MAERSEQSESMLVRSENLDQLLLLAGEVIIVSSNLGLASRNARGLFERSAKVDRETSDMLKDLADSTSDISSKLHKLVQAIRTVELKDLGFRARRTIRDLARRTGKRVRLEVSGEDTVVDKSIVDKLYDPVIHQLRNAVDHGIEDMGTRGRNGKNEEGVVHLRMYNGDRDTFIEIEDDGQGVDFEALRRKAVAAGVVEEGAVFSEQDALAFMCLPGISTAKEVSELSGRGVGMDVVHSRVAELGGTVSLRSTPGKGSTFTFTVPLVSAVNIMDALVVEAGGTMYAFPIAAVLSTMSVPAAQVRGAMDKGRMVKYLDGYVPLMDLDELLFGRQNACWDKDVSLVIVEHKEDRLALRVDSFVNPQKLVIIPIDDVLDIPEIAGATLLGGRRLGYIMDVAAVVDNALHKKSARLDLAAEPRPTAEPAAAAPSPLPHEEKPAQSTAKSAAEAKDEQVVESREFLMEIERLLPSLNQALFALEADSSSEAHMNSSFRLMHTIKGNFMMIGLPKGGETIHSLESVLDAARSRRIELGAEAMDLLLDGASYMEEALRAKMAGVWEDKAREDLIARSAGLLPAKTEETPAKIQDVANGEIVLSHEAAFRLNIHRKRRVPSYRCYLEFDSGKQPPYLVACMIYRRFCELGDVLGTLPALNDIEKGAMDGKMKLLLVTALDQDLIAKALESLLREHYGAKAFELVRVG